MKCEKNTGLLPSASAPSCRTTSALPFAAIFWKVNPSSKKKNADRASDACLATRRFVRTRAVRNGRMRASVARAPRRELSIYVNGRCSPCMKAPAVRPVKGAFIRALLPDRRSPSGRGVPIHTRRARSPSRATSNSLRGRPLPAENLHRLHTVRRAKLPIKI